MPLKDIIWFFPSFLNSICWYKSNSFFLFFCIFIFSFSKFLSCIIVRYRSLFRYFFFVWPLQPQKKTSNFWAEIFYVAKYTSLPAYLALMFLFWSKEFLSSVMVQWKESLGLLILFIFFLNLKLILFGGPLMSFLCDYFI